MLRRGLAEYHIGSEKKDRPDQKLEWVMGINRSTWFRTTHYLWDSTSIGVVRLLSRFNLPNEYQVQSRISDCPRCGLTKENATVCFKNKERESGTMWEQRTRTIREIPRMRIRIRIKL